MKRSISFVSLVALITVMAPMGLMKTQAQSVNTAWSCEFNEVIAEDTALVCDVAIKKEVSVNGGAFQDANTSGSAVTATTGDTVVWRITLTDMSDGGYVPAMDLLVSDILPSGVSYVSHTATDGTFDTNEWSLPVLLVDDETQAESSTLPAVLEIKSTATTVGLWENVATLTSMNCDGWCDYIDDTSENDSDNAFISVQAPVSQPQVLGSSTSTTPTSTPQVLASTGDKQVAAVIAVGLAIMATTLLLTRAVYVAKK